MYVFLSQKKNKIWESDEKSWCGISWKRSWNDHDTPFQTLIIVKLSGKNAFYQKEKKHWLKYSPG